MKFPNELWEKSPNVNTWTCGRKKDFCLQFWRRESGITKPIIAKIRVDIQNFRRSPVLLLIKEKGNKLV